MNRVIYSMNVVSTQATTSAEERNENSAENGIFDYKISRIK